MINLALLAMKLFRATVTWRLLWNLSVTSVCLNRLLKIFSGGGGGLTMLSDSFFYLYFFLQLLLTDVVT